MLGALEYIEWVGETFGEEQAEHYAGEYTGRRLNFKLGMSAIRSYEFDLSRALLDILPETPGVSVYGITDTKRLEERVPTCAFPLAGVALALVICLTSCNASSMTTISIIVNEHWGHAVGRPSPRG